MSAPETLPAGKPPRIVVAGGGTGGHLFPGIAVAEAFIDRNPDTHVLFVGPGRPFEKEALALAGFSQETIAVEGIKGRRLWDKGRAAMKIPMAVFHAARILGRIQADLVVSVGGYAAGPVGLAAWLKGIPLVICEQNTIPGITHRMLFPFASRVFVSFEETRGNIDPARKQLSGNPVRKTVLAGAGKSEEKNEGLTVLVLGGSQGAHAINVAVIEALPHLKGLGNLQFIHQTGKDDQEKVAAAYARHGLSAAVNAFFHDMAACYRLADMVVCRAGATTIAELTALGKPAIFIPYPFAADNHQEHNARFLVNHGAARMIIERELNGLVLADQMNALAASPDLLARMGIQARSLGRPDAASFIVEACYPLFGNLSCT